MTTNDLHREVQEWRNRALLAESQLAVATARPQAHKLPLTNAAGDIEPPLHSDIPESE